MKNIVKYFLTILNKILNMFSLNKRKYIAIGEGNGNPLPYSCLGNSMDWGAW